jgi:hypothetical protein
LRDYCDILKLVEATVPAAVGGSSRDDVLRSSLVGFANETIAEVDRESRWSLSYSELTFVTAAGVSTFLLHVPTGTLGVSGYEIDRVKRMYWLDENLKIQRMFRRNREDLQRMFQEGSTGAATSNGKPLYYAIEYGPAIQRLLTGTGSQATQNSPVMFPYTVYLYPTPDAIYNINVGGFFNTPYIVETTGTTTAASATLTVPSIEFLKKNLVPTAGTGQSPTVSIRNAGESQSASVKDTHIASWTDMPSPTTVTMALAAPTAVTTAQAFFHSTNWMIRFWPKLIQFGMYREIAEYYQNDQKVISWNQRFQEQIQLLKEWDADRARSGQLQAAGQFNADGATESRNDSWSSLGYYGGSW